MRYYNIETGSFETEHRNWKIKILVWFQKCNIIPINCWIYQFFAKFLTQWILKADVPFVKDSEQEIREFCHEHGISTENWEWNKQINEYHTLNEFFMRRYSNLEFGNADVISPATAVLSRFDNMPKNDIKGINYTYENCGIPNPDQYSKNEGYYLYLSPADYHCFHSPIEGTICNIIDYRHLETYSGSVKPDILHIRPSVLTFNRRYIIVIENANIKIAMVIIGGFLVDSIRIDSKIALGSAIAKGQFIGAFALGGSAILLLSTVSLNIPCVDFPVKYKVCQNFTEI